MMPRILQVFEPGCDGVFRHVEQLVEYLWSKNVACDLAFSTRRPSAGLIALVERVRIRGGYVVDLRVGPKPEVRDFVAAKKLIQLVRRAKPAAIHAHSSKAGGLVRLLQPFWSKIPLFYTPNAYYGLDGRKGIAVSIFNFIEYLLAPRATTINVSRDEADFARRVLRTSLKREIIIPNPVDCGRYQPPSVDQRLSARAKFKVKDGQYVIGFASRYAPQKDPETAYRAFADFATRHPDAHLLHLCKSSLLEDARKFVAENNIEDRVTFIDYLEDVRPFYHALDLFLLTSRYEAGWPFVLLEALACNLPIATTACPGLSDIRSQSLAACEVFSVGSTSECVAALDRAYSSRDEIPANHRQTAETRFSIDICFGAVANEYFNANHAAENPGSSGILK